MSNVNFEAMKEQIKQAIIDSSVEGHVDLYDLTNKILNLNSVSENYIKMKLKQAIGVLETHNRWRRGEDVGPMLKPTDIGIAIDTVLEYVKNNSVSDDVNGMFESWTYCKNCDKDIV